MADLLALIRQRMTELEWKKIDLVRALKGKRPGGADVPQATVYQFLQGKMELGHRDMGLVFDVLEITPVTPKPSKRKPKPQD